MHQARTSNAIRLRMAPKSHLSFFTAVEFYRQRKSPDIPPKVAISDWTEHWLAERSRRSTCIGLAILLSSFPLFAIALACLLCLLRQEWPYIGHQLKTQPFFLSFFFSFVVFFYIYFPFLSVDWTKGAGMESKEKFWLLNPPKGSRPDLIPQKHPTYLPTLINIRTRFIHASRESIHNSNAGVFTSFKWKVFSAQNEKYPNSTITQTGSRQSAVQVSFSVFFSLLSIFTALFVFRCFLFWFVFVV